MKIKNVSCCLFVILGFASNNYLVWVILRFRTLGIIQLGHKIRFHSPNDDRAAAVRGLGRLSFGEANRFIPVELYTLFFFLGAGKLTFLRPNFQVVK